MINKRSVPQNLIVDAHGRFVWADERKGTKRENDGRAEERTLQVMSPRQNIGNGIMVMRRCCKAKRKWHR